MSVLMIAEKPSLAQSLAQILSNGNMTTRKNAACPVHEYKGIFYGQNVLFKFTSVCGHVYTADFERRFKNWDTSDPVGLYSAKIVRVEANPKMKLVNFLQKEARGCRFLVLWLDCDKEGENICFEVIDTISGVMNISFRNPQTVFRAYFSAITQKDILDAFNNLRLPNKLEALSVTARQELDLIVGCSFTRYQTRYFQGKYGDLDSTLVSYGPCQVPTLGFCVQRHDDIESFKPQPYWTMSAVVAPVNFSREYLTMEWMGEPEFNNGKIKQIHNSLKDVRRGKIVSIKKTTKTTGKPKALNTVELLKVASAKLGIGPHTAMQIAERLYTQGYISYPRTETTLYPKNFDFTHVLESQRFNNVWGPDVRDLLSQGFSPPRSGHDAGDHPPITPMKAATPAELGGDGWRVYEYITRHFMATLSTDMIHDVVTVIAEIGSQSFRTSCSELKHPGFTKFLPKGSALNEKSIPSLLKENDEILISEIKINNHVTQAPSYLSEAELISLMEKHGIGTDASIPTHINNICQRNYVKISNGRQLIPTKLGILLVHGYRRIDNDLVSSNIRSDMEKELNQIAKGLADFEIVLQKNIDYYRGKFLRFIETIHLMDELFSKNFTSLVETGKPFSKCGKCKRYMKLIETKPERLVCAICNEAYNLPGNGSIKTYKEVQCPIDDFDLLYFSGQKNFIFCPNCYNNPPFEDMAKSMGCYRCTNDDCSFSMHRNTLGPCHACNYSGQLILDQGSGPNWKFLCNNCTFSMTLFKGASKVAIDRQRCQSCQSNYLMIKYQSEKLRKESGMTDFLGCLWCSPELHNVVEAIQNYSRSFNQSQNGGSGGDRGGYPHHYNGRGGSGRGGNNSRGSRGIGRGGYSSRGGGRGSRGRSFRGR
ncbi:DNA topoisomerase 3-beta isoform X2 [Dermatophagoides farinae]|uniref:DNA topoisomerase 3-beta isoform X2 n=1 Tax=Dermatophagoides farinae TaxID=6954 RepID=UPI001F0FBBDD|nr:DNA topoisomerase 3-beta-1-like isoform X2 [Dermatophagoides farinae]